MDYLKRLLDAIERLGSVPLDGVTEHGEGYGVELVRSPTSGRLCIRATNEGGNNHTMVDVFELIDCLRFGPDNQRIPGGFTILI